MSSLGKDLIAFTVVKMLVTPFTETKAFRLGIIDERGNVIRAPKTPEEHDAYSALDRIVFNLKKLIEKVPGGKSKIASFAAAAWLIKEHGENADLEKFKQLQEKNICFVEEEIEVMKIMEEIAANNTSGVEVKNPDAIPKRKMKSLKDLLRRRASVNTGSLEK